MRAFLIGAGAALLAGCATSQQDQPAELAVTLTGLQEVPGPGDPDGTGTAQIRVTPANGQLCWNLYVRDIAPASAAHIHRGAAGSSGPPVVTLTTPDQAGRSQGCVTLTQELAREIAGRGYDFYVNIHNAEHPAGAVRGQLRGTVIRPQRDRSR
jgi:hypothetical protein